MKNIFFAFALALVLVGGASTASAHEIFDTNGDPIPHSHGNGDPMLVSMPWGLTGYQTPRVASGAVVVDETGISDTCPAWFPAHMGCFDITRTEYYRTRMIDLGKQLLALGYTEQSAPRFAGWISIARGR